MSLSTAARIGKEKPVPANQARARLRQLTSDAHEALHLQSDFTAIMSGKLTICGYAALLNRLHYFHDLFEQLVGNAPKHLVPEIDLDTRRMAHLLSADIAALGMRVSRFHTSPLRGLLPDMRSAESLVGSLYVVEGARLGGSVIAQKLDYLLGHEGRSGRQFFRGRGIPDSLPWSRFCDILENHAVTGDFDKIKAAALQTFDAIAFALNDCPSHV
jgi:heme oxygenase